jgi:hypothetical protein
VIKGGNHNKITFESVWPEETCPVCGKTWTRFCRKREWGYWYNDSPSQHTSKLILLCSSPCAKKYAEMKAMERVKEFLKTRTAQAIRLIETEHLSQHQAVKRAGLANNGSVSWSYDCYWREIEWLNAHNWEVAG